METAFPHLRRTPAGAELYRVGATDGLDWPRLELRVRKGAGPDEVWLIANPACPAPPAAFDEGFVPLRDLHIGNGSQGRGGVLQFLRQALHDHAGDMAGVFRGLPAE